MTPPIPVQKPHWTIVMFARWTRRLCRVAGIVGMLLSIYALLDPSILVSSDMGAFAPPSPRWRAALGLVLSVLVFGYGMRAEAHRSRE